MGLQDKQHRNIHKDEHVINFLERSHHHHLIMTSKPTELSDTWRKLFETTPTSSPETPGINQAEETQGTQANRDEAMITPSDFADDPWSGLLARQGVEMLDLQHIRLADIHISLSEMEVEQALQIIQEQPAKNRNQT